MWTIPRQPFMRPHRLQNQSVSCTLRTYRGMFRFVNAHSIANRSTLHRGGYGSDQQPFDIIITYKLIITNRTQMLSVWFAIWIYGLHRSHCLQNLSVSRSLRTYRGMFRFGNRSRIQSIICTWEPIDTGYTGEAMGATDNAAHHSNIQVVNHKANSSIIIMICDRNLWFAQAGCFANPTSQSSVKKI